MAPALSPAVPLPVGQWEPRGKAFCRRLAETSLFPEEQNPLSIGISKLLAKLKGLTDVITASWGLLRNF